MGNASAGPTSIKVQGLQVRAAVVPASLNEQDRTFEIIWTTGARGLRRPWFGPEFWEELEVTEQACDLSRLNNGAPFLNAHNGYSLEAVLGVLDSAWIVPGEGHAKVRLSSRDGVAPIMADIRDGILRHVSVGYDPLKYEQVGEEEGKPILRATRWLPMEVSLVPMGFDDAAVIRATAHRQAPVDVPVINTRSASSAQPENRMDPKTRADGGEPAKNETPAEGEGTTRICGDCAEMPIDDPMYAECCGEAATADQGNKRSKQPRKSPAALDAKAIAAAERKRAAEIRKFARLVKIDESLADLLVEEGVTVDEARSRMSDRLAEKDAAANGDRGHRPPVSSGEDATEKFARGAGDWVILRAGQSRLINDAEKKRGRAESKFDPGEFRGLSFVELARQALEISGVRTRGMDKHAIIGRALTQRGGLQGTSAFATLLENVMHKVLLSSYEITPDTWSLFCARGSVSDFRPHNRYRLGSLRALDVVNENGEFKNQPISDAEKETITARTKGNIVAITRQALISDDMGGLSRVPAQIGRAAALSIENDVYALLAENAGLGPLMSDGNTLFHATHTNIGAGSAIGVSAIDADRVVMGSQKDPAGKEFLDIRPAVLVVSLGLGGTARTINAAEFDLDAVAFEATNKFMVPNRVRGLFRSVVDSPRLADETRRYMFADPGAVPTIEVAFLDGQEAPFLDSQDGWRVDGVEWKVRLDYAVGAVDFRGAVTNAGG